MKTFFRRIGWWLKVLAVLAVALAVAGDLYCEVIGLPEVGRRQILERLERRGIVVDTGTVYLGVLRGLVAEDVVVWDGGRQGVRLMTAGSCRASLAPAQVLRGRLAARSVWVREARLHLPVQPEAEASRAAPLVVEDLTLNLVLAGDDVHVRHLTGTAGGVRLDLSGTFANARRALAGAPGPAGERGASGQAAAGAWRLGWHLVVAAAPPRALACLASFKAYCDRQLFVSDDAVLKARFEVDLERPELASIAGAFQVSDIGVRGVQVRRCKGRFRAGEHTVRLDNATAYIGMDHVVNGELTLNLQTREIRGRASGTLEPSLLFRALDQPMPAWLAATQFAVPPFFDVELEPSPSARPADWHGRCTVKADHVLYGANHLRHLSATVTRKPGRVDIEGLAAAWTDGQQQLSGALAFDEQTRRLSGGLAGAIYPTVILRSLPELPVAWRQAVESVHFTGPPAKIALTLDGCGLAVEQWHGTLAIDASSIRWRDWPLDLASCTVVCRPGRVNIENLAIAASDQLQRLAGAIGYDEQSRRLSGRLEGTVAPAAVLRNLPELPPAWQDALAAVRFTGPPARFDLSLDECGLAFEEWNGTLAVELYDVGCRGLALDRVSCPLRLENGVLHSVPALEVRDDDGGLRGATCEVTLDTRTRRLAASGALEVFLGPLCRELGLPDSRLLAELAFHGPPTRVQFTLEEGPLTPADWRVHGTVAARQFQLESLPVDSLDAAFTADARSLAFHDVRVASPQFDRFEVESFTADWRTGDFELCGEAEGDPLALGVFVDPGNSRQWFTRVWAPFAWGGPAPRLRFDNLSYHSRPGTWSLDAVIGLDAGRPSFRGLAADALQAEIILRLPAAIEIRNLAVQQGEAEVRGDIRFDLEGEAMAEFTCAGVFDPVAAFTAALPELREDLADLGTGPGTRVDMRGNLHLAGASRPRITCTLEGPQFRFQRLVTGPYRGDWQLVENDLRWNLSEAEFHGGALYVAGNHSSFLGSGRVEIGARDVDVNSLLRQFRPDREPTRLGKLSGTADVTIQRRGAGRPWRLTGGGRAHITEGNLWDAPLLAGLGTLVGAGRIGRISRLDLDLEFLGDRLHVPEFATDGTILSLKGFGDYYWGADRVSFTVSGQALKGTSVVPMVLRPLSWFFDAQLEGPLDSCEWRLLNPLRRILPGQDEPAPETLPLPPAHTPEGTK